MVGVANQNLEIELRGLVQATLFVVLDGLAKIVAHDRLISIRIGTPRVSESTPELGDLVSILRQRRPREA